MKIVTVIGARPQFIKAAAVSHAMAKKGSINEVLLHTGQHFDANMSEVFFSELEIAKPIYNLGIGGGLHGSMTGAQLAAIEPILIKEEPDWVLVYGDTNSTLAGALAAAKLHIPVAHVEAGLRSFNRRMPEEINRVLVDHLSTVLFAPTDAAMIHLSNEGIAKEKCHQVGDVMLDAAHLFGTRSRQSSNILELLGLQEKKYILATIHRAENTDDSERLRFILSALGSVAATLPVVWPVHPRTRKRLIEDQLLGLVGARLQLVDPLGYLDMIRIEQGAAVIATDSGGVQKEAFFYGVPCVTLRDETEWFELVDAGWNKVVSPVDAESILRAIISSIGIVGKFIKPYGDGDAAEMIAEYFCQAVP